MSDELKKELEEIKRYSMVAAKNVLNIEDVAFMLGVSKSNVYKLTCNKEIPYYRPNGKYVYFDRSEVESWMKQNRQASKAETEQIAINHVVLSQKGGKA